MEKLEFASFPGKIYVIDSVGAEFNRAIAYLRAQKIIGFDTEPYMENDRTYVPMRKIFEVFEADVQWEGETETVTAVTEEKTIVLQINNNVLK